MSQHLHYISPITKFLFPHLTETTYNYYSFIATPKRAAFIADIVRWYSTASHDNLYLDSLEPSRFYGYATPSKMSHSSYGSNKEQSRSPTEAPQPRVEVLRCSRCAKCVETVTTGRGSDSRRVSADDASASGMVRFGHNLYYCDRCAKMVGYK